jgi:hypothetical protein
MTTIVTEVYTFEELSEEAKEKAREWWRECDASYMDWWECIGEDAENVGIQIKEFDLYARSCKISFDEPDEEVMKKIKETHGEECDTYKAAMEFLAAITAIRMRGEDVSEWTLDREEAHEAFEGSLMRCYRDMLEREYDYRGSDECVDETILINEYTFTEDGVRFG